MNEFEYLQNSDDDEVLNTWAAFGSVWVNNSTRAYIKDTLVIVNCPGSPVHQRVVYIIDSHFGTVDWNNVKNDRSDLLVLNGIMMPWFKVLPTKFTGTFTEDKTFKPYSHMKDADCGGVIMPDDILEIIMSCIGFPAVEWQDTEVGPAAVKRVYIKQALMKYWAFRPKIIPEGIGWINANEQFRYEAPEGAWDAMPFFSTGPKMGTWDAVAWRGIDCRRGFIKSPGLAIKGVTTGKYGCGYDAMDTVGNRFDPEMVMQGNINHYRQEYLNVRQEDGKVFVEGYSTTGGNLNIQWLFGSYNWKDIPYNDVMTLAIPLCQSVILENIALIRGLVKADIPGALDASVLKERKTAIDTNLDKILGDVALNGAAGISR